MLKVTGADLLSDSQLYYIVRSCIERGIDIKEFTDACASLWSMVLDEKSETDKKIWNRIEMAIKNP